VYASCLTGCFPFVGRWDRPIGDEPVRFVDAVSGKPVDRVLVIPVYETGFGAWAMPEGDPGATLESATIANAFIYPSGEAFQIKQPLSWGIVWLFLGLTGSATSLDRVYVCAPGYALLRIWSVWDRPSEYALAAASRGERTLSALDLGRMLQRGNVTAAEKRTLGFGDAGTIKVKLGAEELGEILSFLGMDAAPP
jgi:hypothetical protein